MRLLPNLWTWIPLKRKYPGQSRDFDTFWGVHSILRQRNARWIAMATAGLILIGLLTVLFGGFSSREEKAAVPPSPSPLQAAPLQENRQEPRAPKNPKANDNPSAIATQLETRKALPVVIPNSQNHGLSLTDRPSVRERKIPDAASIVPSAGRSPGKRLASNPRGIPRILKSEDPVAQGSAMPLYEKAKWYHRQERYDEAIGLYQQVVRFHPKHFNARFNLVSAYVETHDFARAKALALELRNDFPENQQLAINLAIALIGAGRPAEAISLLDAQTSLASPLEFENHFYKGLAHRQLNQPDHAIQSYLKAEQLRPHDGRLLFNLAVLFDRERRYWDAVNYYQKYLRAMKNAEAPDRQRVEQRIRILSAGLGSSPAPMPSP